MSLPHVRKRRIGRRRAFAGTSTETDASPTTGLKAGRNTTGNDGPDDILFITIHRTPRTSPYSSQLRRNIDNHPYPVDSYHGQRFSALFCHDQPHEEAPLSHILIAHEDALLRGRYRKLYERNGHTVSEITSVNDRDPLPHDLVIDEVITTLEPLLDHQDISPYPLYQEHLHSTHSAR